MYRIFFLAILSTFLFHSYLNSQSNASLTESAKVSIVKKCDTLYYFGIDCSHVRISDGEKTPRSMLYSTVYPIAWINYLEKEMPPIEYVQSSLNKNVFYYNQEEIYPVSIKVVPDFIIKKPWSFPVDTVKTAVRKYKLTEKSGIGLVLIPENFNKQDEQATTWVVFFDIGNREILWATRVSGHCKHMGYTAHWGSGIINGFKSFIRNDYR